MEFIRARIIWNILSQMGVRKGAGTKENHRPKIVIMFMAMCVAKAKELY